METKVKDIIGEVNTDHISNAGILGLMTNFTQPQQKYKIFIKNDYQKLYGKIKLKSTTIRDNVLEFSLERNADIINGIDLTLENPDETYSVNNIIKQIYFIISNQIVDVLKVEDIATQIETTLGILEPTRSITQINQKLFIPLPMSLMLNGGVGIPVAAMKHQDIIISITFDKHYPFIRQAELYGNNYYLDVYDLHSLVNFNHKIETFHTQYYGCEKISQGTNIIKCFFNHQVGYIYFWGDYNRNDIKNIKVVLNNKINYYNGPIEPLLYRMKSSNLDNLSNPKKPIIIKFTDTDKVWGKLIESTYNLTCICCELIIDFKDNVSIQDNTNMYVVAISKHPMSLSSGKLILKYNTLF